MVCNTAICNTVLIIYNNKHSAIVHVQYVTKAWEEPGNEATLLKFNIESGFHMM